jgi:urease accessory protein
LQQLLAGLPELDSAARSFLEQRSEPHLALGWALAARAWDIKPEDALAAWLWSWLENQLAVLMKTLPLGQQAAQRLTSELLPLLQQAQQIASNIDPDHYGSAAFGLSLACMAHERQYSRLFRS